MRDRKFVINSTDYLFDYHWTMDTFTEPLSCMVENSVLNFIVKFNAGQEIKLRINYFYSLMITAFTPPFPS